jgi:GNAT superfamily N-acetyltransferase
MGDRSGDYRIERMSLSDVDVAIDWAACEGWNPGLNDAVCFRAIDPGGFFMGALDGRMIASGSAPIYDGQFAFIGLYIVEPAFRGKGYGLALTKAMFDYVGDRNAGLDGVEIMAERYARLGFRRAHRSARHAFRPTSSVKVAEEIVPLARVPFAELAKYDRRHFFAPRDNFLKVWVTQPDVVALGFVDAGALKGCGVLRKCRNGHKIGPLFAEGLEIAESLFDGLCNHAIGDSVFIDMPEPNPAAARLAAKRDMKPRLCLYPHVSPWRTGLAPSVDFRDHQLRAGLKTEAH